MLTRRSEASKPWKMLRKCSNWGKMTKILFFLNLKKVPKPKQFKNFSDFFPKLFWFRNVLKGLGRKTTFVILLELDTFLSTFYTLVLLIDKDNQYIYIYICYQFLGLDFLLWTLVIGEKNIVNESLLAQAEPETEITHLGAFTLKS